MKRSIFTLMFCLAAVIAFAARDPGAVASDTVYVKRGTIVIFNDSLAETSMMPADRGMHLSNDVFPAKKKIKVKFAWGADLGASIDMSGNDMSAVDFGLVFGMKRGWINFLGLGAQANIPVSNSNRSYPLFLMFRTNFTDRPTRVFWELKGGVALNYLEHDLRQTGIYGCTGIGIKLATGAKFSSHMTIGYTYIQRKSVVGEEMTKEFPDLHFATVKIGVVF